MPVIIYARSTTLFNFLIVAVVFLPVMVKLTQRCQILETMASTFGFRNDMMSDEIFLLLAKHTIVAVTLLTSFRAFFPIWRIAAFRVIREKFEGIVIDEIRV